MHGVRADAVQVGVSRYEVTLDFAAGRDPCVGVARVHVAHAFHDELLDQLRESFRAWQLDRALALEDGTALALDDGTWALGGRRRIRDGARCMMFEAAGLFRLDLRTMQDSYAVSLRNLSGVELSEPPHPPVGAAVVEVPGGGVLHQNEVAFAWPDGPRVRVVTRVPAYRGQLELDCVAVALVSPPR